MKKSLIVVLSIVYALFLTGCSLEDSTSIGNAVINDIDPTILDVSKNFQPFDLDSSIVDSCFSIPGSNQDTVFGVHSSNVFPIGGRNGEIATGYIELISNFNTVSDFKLIESIDSIMIVFDTVNSGKADCNFAQSIKLTHVTDSTYKYNRGERNIATLVESDIKSYLLNPNTFEKNLDDSIFQNKIFAMLKSGIDASGIKQKSLFIPDTFRFVLHSESNSDNFAYFYSKPNIRIYTQSSTKSDSTYLSHDTSSSQAVGQTIHDTILRSDANKAHYFLDDSIGVRVTKIGKHTVISKTDTIQTSVKISDTQFDIIDSITTTVDSVLDTISITRNRVMTGNDTLFTTWTSDTARSHSTYKTLTVTLKKVTPHTYTLPTTYSNYAVYELTDTVAARKELPYTSFGPQRTAVFKISLDSLWNKLNTGVDVSGIQFNELLTASIKITGTIDYRSLTALSDTTANSDSTIAIRWFISDMPIHNGIKLSSKYRYWSSLNTLKNGHEAELQIEKYLQEMMSAYGSSTGNAKGPSIVYLYVEQLSSGIYWKQINWSKPSLTTVLTNLN